MTYCVCGAPVSEHVLGRCDRTNCKSFVKGHRKDRPPKGAQITRCSECKRRPISRQGRQSGWSNHAEHCSRHGARPDLSENQKVRSTP